MTPWPADVPAPRVGPLSVEEAVAAIAAAPVPSASRTAAADGLGELVACLILAGQPGAQAGPLSLSGRPEQLTGVLAPSPSPAVAAAV